MEIESRQEILLSYFCDEKDGITVENTKIEDGTKNSISLNLILKNLSSIKTDLDLPIDLFKINRLDLSGCNLDTLPRSFGKLQLKELNLARNCFSSVPDCFYNGLKSLEVLDFSYNEIKTFDLSPDCLHSLKVLKFNNNKTENVPKWILTFSATNLLEFDYSFNRAKNYKYYIENNINLDVTKLEKLTLVDCCLIDEDFPFLKKIKSLQYLDISSGGSKTLNKFIDLDVLFIKPKWAELYTLKVNNLALSIFPDGIMWHESLREIYINKNFISWLPDGFEFLVNLEVLEISNNELIALPQKLINLEYLTILKADGNKIESYPDFSKFQYLKVLDLYNNYIESDSILKQIEHIECLDLDQNFFEINCDELYENKRKRLMEKYNLDHRISGCKERFFRTESESSKSESDLMDLTNEPINFDYSAIKEDEENWDEIYNNFSCNFQSKKINLNYSISLSDEEWQGEEKSSFLQNYFSSSTCRSYIDVDEKLFCDAD